MLVALQVLAWCVLFSLLAQRTLVALCFGAFAIATTLVLQLVVAQAFTADSTGTIAFVSVVALGIVAADVRLAMRWFSERTVPWRRKTVAEILYVSRWKTDKPSKIAIFARLCWLEIRQSATLTMGLFVLPSSLFIVLVFQLVVIIEKHTLGTYRFTLGQSWVFCGCLGDTAAWRHGLPCGPDSVSLPLFFGARHFAIARVVQPAIARHCDARRSRGVLCPAAYRNSFVFPAERCLATCELVCDGRSYSLWCGRRHSPQLLCWSVVFDRLSQWHDCGNGQRRRHDDHLYLVIFYGLPWFELPLDRLSRGRCAADCELDACP